jgi:hypothetical protein
VYINSLYKCKTFYLYGPKLGSEASSPNPKVRDLPCLICTELKRRRWTPWPCSRDRALPSPPSNTGAPPHSGCRHPSPSPPLPRGAAASSGWARWGGAGGRTGWLASPPTALSPRRFVPWNSLPPTWVIWLRSFGGTGKDGLFVRKELVS